MSQVRDSKPLFKIHFAIPAPPDPESHPSPQPPDITHTLQHKTRPAHAYVLATLLIGNPCIIVLLFPCTLSIPLKTRMRR